VNLETHEAVFTWILQRLADAGLVKGKTVGIDATTLEANAAPAAVFRSGSREVVFTTDCQVGPLRRPLQYPHPFIRLQP